jgi:hypothetical protein
MRAAVSMHMDPVSEWQWRCPPDFRDVGLMMAGMMLPSADHPMAPWCASTLGARVLPRCGYSSAVISSFGPASLAGRVVQAGFEHGAATDDGIGEQMAERRFWSRLVLTS